MTKERAWAGVIGLSVAVVGLADEVPADDDPDVLVGPLEAALEWDGEEDSQGLASGFEDAYVTLAVVPRYPKRALRKDLDGEVTLAFDISRHGRAENITIAENTSDKKFGEEALEAMRFWAFSPARLELCGTAPQTGRQTFVFDHDGDPKIRLLPLVVNDVPQVPRPMKSATLREYHQAQRAASHATYVTDPRKIVTVARVEPEYPMEALERRKEGMVAIFFLVETDGNISNVDVIDSVNGRLFRKPALQAIRKWKFKPRTRKGRPVETPACHEFIFHLDEYERSGKLARQRQNKRITTYAPDQ